jgi:hypothetical protein
MAIGGFRHFTVVDKYQFTGPTRRRQNIAHPVVISQLGMFVMH